MTTTKKWTVIAVVSMCLVVGITAGMANDEGHYVLAGIMVLMVLLYTAVEMGWGGGSADKR